MTDLVDRFKRFMPASGEESAPVDPKSAEEPECTRPGELVRAGFGPVRSVEKRLETAIPYAPGMMREILTDSVTDRCRYLKDERLRGFRREHALFLDVETTGLSHGAGTVAFLVGLGWFDGDDFVVRQLLLDDYDQEPAQLDLLLDCMGGREYLVTYNGKSFDRSVLENRLVINRFMDRQEAHVRLMPHLDLLHLGRRVHRGKLSSHTLGTLEREVLGFDRGEDIPGELVPQFYFQYLMSGRGEHIDPVLAHNFDDIVSLVHLADALLRSIDPDSPPRDPILAFNLGKLFFNSGYPEQAVMHLEAALDLADSLSPDHLLQAARRLARAYRLLEAPWQRSLRLWERIREVLPDSPGPHLEVSKLHEWKAGDLSSALSCAHTALELAPDDSSLSDRVARLTKRLQRQRNGT